MPGKAQWTEDAPDKNWNVLHRLQFCEDAYIELTKPADTRFDPKVELISCLEQRTLASFRLKNLPSADLSVARNEAIKVCMLWIMQLANRSMDMANALLQLYTD